MSEWATEKKGSIMGTFHIGCRIENHVHRAQSVIVPKMLVDTGSEYTWIPSAKLEKIGVLREKKDIQFVMAMRRDRLLEV